MNRLVPQSKALFAPLLAGAIVLAAPAAAEPGGANASSGPWEIRSLDNPDGPGRAIDVRHAGEVVARFIHGEGQMKPFLHVFGTDGELLTNPGLDAGGQSVGRFPHHRGIFIGWNKIRSDLGSDDLWHFGKNESMEVTSVRQVRATGEFAEIVADVAWRSRSRDAAGENLLLEETRTMRITRPDDGETTVIDVHFQLTASRDIELGGDLQHAGVHFRAHHETAGRAGETVYFWSPDVGNGNGRIINPDMRWCRLVFPRGDRWYSAIQLNGPGNPTEELSWRDYGRFGFFFNRSLKQGETLALDYRFVVSPIVSPGDKGYTEAVTSSIRERSEDMFRDYVKRP